MSGSINVCETKTFSSLDNTTPTAFYTNVLPLCTNQSTFYYNLFVKSAELSKASLQNNPPDPDIQDKRNDPNTCLHDRSENWNSNQCADCGHTNIGGTRVADEKRFAEIAKIEDHQYLVDQLKPILGSMQVTRAVNPGEGADLLGIGTLGSSVAQNIPFSA